MPAVIEAAGRKAKRRFVEFFTAEIRNENTRNAFLRAIGRFCRWCEKRKIGLGNVEPTLVAMYIEELGVCYSKATVKQHLAAVRMLFDYLVITGKGTPLFRTLGRKRHLTDRRMHRNDALRMIKRRALQAGVSPDICCHTFRATGITEYMRNGGTLEKAQQMTGIFIAVSPLPLNRRRTAMLTPSGSAMLALPVYGNDGLF